MICVSNCEIFSKGELSSMLQFASDLYLGNYRILRRLLPLHFRRVREIGEFKQDSLVGFTSRLTGYSTLCAQNEMVESWPWKLIWLTKLLPKVICFTWTAL